MDILFFDIGYTLVDETAVWERRCGEQAETARAKELGLSPDDIFREICAASRAYKPWFATAAEKFGFTHIAPYRHALETLYPGVPELLEALSRDFRLGIIANQKTGLEERLEHFGIRQYFDVVVSSSDCGAAKPDPGIFEYALRTAGCRAADACMIGDRIDNDIAPAKACGMRTVWVRQGFGALQTPRTPEEEPDETADSIAELSLMFGTAAQTPPPDAPESGAVTGSVLVDAAYHAMRYAYAPYSRHTVGAALLAADGRIFTGCNVENAAFTPTCCAERVALFKAVSEGVREFSAIAVVGGKYGNTQCVCTPCGVCRQALREFCAPQTFLILLGCDGGTAEAPVPVYKEYTLAELLPESFGPESVAD